MTKTRKSRARETIETLTPQELYQCIDECWRIISEANERLRAMGSRPINICATPADVPPFTWLPAPARKKVREK